MNTKALYAAIAVIILVIAGLFIYNQSNKNDNTNNLNNQNQVSNLNTEADLNTNNSNTSDNTNTPANTNNSNANHFSGESDIQGKVVEVDYDGSKFTPATVTINIGDTVAFKNTSSSTNVWPASDPHPTHTGYPGFDALKVIAPGGVYSFTFTKSGTWGYHNHLNPIQKGTVIVK